MPLDHYGVLIGSLHRSFRDQPDTQGRWYHVNLEIDAPAGRYRCAVDVDSKQSAVGVEWRVLDVPAAMLQIVPGLSTGYHELARSRSAGAVDLIRHPALANLPGCLFVRQPPAWMQELLNRLFPRRPWTSGSNLEAATALESTLSVGRRTLVFGEPFRTGFGMHNIHQNQGDPVGSQWFAENAIWQDGATLTEEPGGSYKAFVSKFSSQSSNTDDDGHPL
jgi:Uncharacterized conserved protein (DUF2278)